MKLILASILLLNICTVKGQKHLDTLRANERQVLSVFFPAPIEKAITGADHFAFTFNREKSETLGLLQATPGQDSNLLVLTQNGGIYSFVLSYRDSLEHFTRFIASNGSLAPLSKAPNTPKKGTGSLPGVVSKICRQMLSAQVPYKSLRGPKGIRLSMSEGFYHGDYVYIRYELENSSAVNYEIDSFTLYKVLGNASKKSSYQEQTIAPLYAYQLLEEVPQATATRFVLVYPKFTMGAQESLKVDLREHRGSRNATFKFRRL